MGDRKKRVVNLITTSASEKNEGEASDFSKSISFNFHLNDSVLTHLSSMGKSQWSLNFKNKREKEKQKWVKTEKI